MDTKTIKYEPRPFAITLAVVIGLELFPMALPVMDPLYTTGIIRALQAVFIVWSAFWFADKACIAGLFPAGMKKGVIRGLIWSAIFGLAAAIIAAVLALAGLDPVGMIGIGLPSEKKLLVVFFLVAALLGPVAEELFFRGVVYGFLRRFGVATALLGSSAVFVLAHSPAGIAFTHLIGALVFAAAYEYEKNIMVPVTIHVMGNLALFSTVLLR